MCLGKKRSVPLLQATSLVLSDLSLRLALLFHDLGFIMEKYNVQDVVIL